MITSTLGQRKRARTWCFPQSPGKDSSLASGTWSRSKHARVCFHCDHRSARNLNVNVLRGAVSGQGQISAHVGIRGLSKHRRADLGVESQGVSPLPQNIKKVVNLFEKLGDALWSSAGWTVVTEGSLIQFKGRWKQGSPGRGRCNRFYFILD